MKMAQQKFQICCTKWKKESIRGNFSGKSSLLVIYMKPMKHFANIPMSISLDTIHFH
jgi:hypothetical protein